MSHWKVWSYNQLSWELILSKTAQTTCPLMSFIDELLSLLLITRPWHIMLEILPIILFPYARWSCLLFFSSSPIILNYAHKKMDKATKKMVDLARDLVCSRSERKNSPTSHFLLYCFPENPVSCWNSTVLTIRWISAGSQLFLASSVEVSGNCWGLSQGLQVFTAHLQMPEAMNSYLRSSTVTQPRSNHPCLHTVSDDVGMA